MSPQENNSIRLLGCRVDSVTWDQVESFCRQALTGSEPKHIITINGEHILSAQKNEAYRTLINQADLNIPDSTNVAWISHLKGRGLPQVTPGVDLTTRLARIAAETESSVFLLGGRNDVAEEAAKALQKQFPNLKIAGTSNADPNNNQLVEEIRASGAAIVLVAYGAPTHDFWINQNKATTGAKILVGIGGTFDMLAGRLPRAPQFLRTLHLEWLWRLILEPSRFGRIWNAVVVFPFKALLTDQP